MKKIDLAYIAGIVDGEGYIGIKKSKAYKCQGRVSPGYHARIGIRMVNEEAIRFLAETLGGWYYPEKPHATKGKPLYCYQATDDRAAKILEILLPFLRVKKAQAQNVLAFRKHQLCGPKHRTKILGYRNFPNKYGTPRQVPNLGYTDEFVERCEQFYLRGKELNA